MSKPVKAIVISLIVLVVLYFASFNLPVYSTDTYLDVHSGNTKVIHRVCSVKVKEEIRQTEFSNIVRKFTDVQKEPGWKYCYGHYLCPVGGGSRDNFKWGSFPMLCKEFVAVVDPNRISESQERELLQGCLSDMENGDPGSFHTRLDAYKKNRQDN
jgi:hypothetical protein